MPSRLSTRRYVGAIDNAPMTFDDGSPVSFAKWARWSSVALTRPKRAVGHTG